MSISINKKDKIQKISDKFEDLGEKKKRTFD